MSASPLLTHRPRASRAVATLLALSLLLALVAGGGLAARTGLAQGDATAAATPAITTIALTGSVVTPLDLTVADLQTYPAETVDVTFTAAGEPQDHTYTGTPLLGLIEAAGLDVPEDARNPLLTHYVVVTATDGYQLVISGGELDPNFGAQPMLLAWEEDGAPLSAEDGPARLVVPGDTRGGRYVTGVISIEVVSLDAANYAD
jgi:DMSO/TMAO reductase YedYZ molybdopterin-dependent catalytic subunit